MEMFVFYVKQFGAFWKFGILSDSKEKVLEYLEGLSNEVRYKGTEEVKPSRYGTKKLPCGELYQYKFYGRFCPRGLEIDRRHHLL